MNTILKLKLNKYKFIYLNCITLHKNNYKWVHYRHTDTVKYIFFLFLNCIVPTSDI